jgi:hypothetical protein
MGTERPPTGEWILMVSSISGATTPNGIKWSS